MSKLLQMRMQNKKQGQKNQTQKITFYEIRSYKIQGT